MEKETKKGKLDLAAKRLQAAHELFQSTIIDLGSSARAYPILEAYIEKVFVRGEEDDYGIGDIRSVIDLMDDSDQEQPRAEAVEKIFEVFCRELMFGKTEWHVAVFRTKTEAGTEFAVVHSEFEDPPKNAYPDKATFQSAYRTLGALEWFDEFDAISEELNILPWTRGELCFVQPEYKEQIENLVRKTQAHAPLCLALASETQESRAVTELILSEEG